MSATKIIGSHSFDWESFYDVATTTDAARVLNEMFGEGAAEAVIKCALAARDDGRPKDHAYWMEVLEKLPRQLH